MTMITRPRRCPLRKPRVWLWALIVALPAHVALAWAMNWQPGGRFIACPVATPLHVKLVEGDTAAPQTVPDVIAAPARAVAKPKQHAAAQPSSAQRALEPAKTLATPKEPQMAVIAPAAGAGNRAKYTGVQSIETIGFANPPRPAIYPALSRRNGEQGTAMLLAYLTQRGAAADIKLERSSGYERLDMAALEVAESWRFNAPPEPVWVRVPVRFALNN